MKTNIMLRRVLHYPVLLLLLTMTSCGLWSVSEPAAEEEPEDDRLASVEASDETESGTVAVADFQYVTMPYPLSYAIDCAINDEWLYFAVETWYEERPSYTYISKKRISDGYLAENYIVSTASIWDMRAQLLLADAAGNCYIFWGPGNRKEEGEAVYSLAKYGVDGEELWYVDYASEELLDMGEGLRQGTVTKDGRVFLCGEGAGGSVFAFREDGTLEAVYTPDMEKLAGVAVGKEDKIYGYGNNGSDFLFMELEGTGETYICPMYPMEVYSGYGGGVCLCVGERMWRYEPETGETELLWSLKDEYMQLGGEHMKEFYYDGEICRMLFTEQVQVNTNIRQFITFVSVSFGNRRDYPGKQKITLSSIFHIRYELEILVKLYNRQSKKYRVEIVPEGSASSLEMKLLQRKGEDLIDLSMLYADNLAEFGAFEDLTSYYESGGSVGWEDILEPIREACIIRDKNVAVIPSFSIRTMLERENWFTAEEWNVWEFLKMGQGKQALPTNQDPRAALRYCMGIRYGEHFVDYENKECHFDSDEFRQVLEECSKWENYSTDRYYFNFETGDHLLEDGTYIGTLWDMVWDNMVTNTVDESYSSRMVGYPGWDGGEHEIYALTAFAINSTSENKEGAWDFLEYLLSSELQDMIQYWCCDFPVRTDSFEASLEDLYINPMYLRPTDSTYKPAIPTQEDIALLRKMIDSAVYQGWSQDNNQVRRIVEEEAQMYFAGDSLLDETVRKIQNRVQLYLDEM